MGKIRHLHTADLWVQEKVRSKAITLLKVLGTENPADAFTKYLDTASMEKAIRKMQCEYRTGRAKLAPETMGLSKAS